MLIVTEVQVVHPSVGGMVLDHNGPIGVGPYFRSRISRRHLECNGTVVVIFVVIVILVIKKSAVDVCVANNIKRI